MTITLEKMEDNKIVPAQAVDKILKLETLKKQIDSELKELRERLLLVMECNDVESIKTGAYTISRAERATIKVDDDLLAAESLRAMDIEVKTKTVLDDCMMPTVKELSKSGKLIEGVSTNITPYVSIRVKKEKGE